MVQTDWRAERLRVPAGEWLGMLDREYLLDFIRSGGSVVKVVSGSDTVLSDTAGTLSRTASTHGFHFAALNPAKLGPDGKKPDLHRIDRFFFETTRDVNWKDWAAAEARRFLESRGIRVADHRLLNDLEGIATDNGRDPTDLRGEYQSEFATPLIRDYRLAIEFRRALTNLSRAQLLPD